MTGRALAAAVAAALASACSGNGDDGGDSPGDGAAADAAGASDAATPFDAGQIAPLDQFVIDTIALPASEDAIDELALDLDGDGDPDGAMGELLVALAEAGGAPQALIDGALAGGSIVQLLDLERAPPDQSSTLGLFVGDDRDGDPSDNFTGGEMFAIGVDTPTDGELRGQIDADARLLAGPGRAPLRVPLGLARPHAVLLNAVGVRVSAVVEDDRLSGGVLGGALTTDQVKTVYLPALLASIEEAVAEDCDRGTCVPGSTGAVYLALFDGDRSGEVGEVELEESQLVESALAPDLDLFDAEGRFDPDTDGVPDAVSFGIGFTAVGAAFAAP